MVENQGLNLRDIINKIKKYIDNNEHISCQRENIKIFDTNPWDFLNYCRQDLDDDSERGRTNALSNAKRAIECRVDEIITLMNLRYFAFKHHWGLPYKLHVIKTFKISAPDVLVSYITSKRNILEHKYIKPKTIDEIKHIADITELFLSASDRIVEQGYVLSIMLENEEKLPEIQIDKWKKKWLVVKSEHLINFDLKKENITSTIKQFENNYEWNNRTFELSQNTNPKLVNEQTNIISIQNCDETEIKELMKLLVKT